MYWAYNFAPACKLRPAHNVYEIFWVTKGEKWYYYKRCSTIHCEKGEPNLTTLIFKRDYKMNMPQDFLIGDKWNGLVGIFNFYVKRF